MLIVEGFLILSYPIKVVILYGLSYSRGIKPLGHPYTLMVVFIISMM